MWNKKETKEGEKKYINSTTSNNFSLSSPSPPPSPHIDYYFRVERERARLIIRNSSGILHSSCASFLSFFFLTISFRLALDEGVKKKSENKVSLSALTQRHTRARPLLLTRSRESATVRDRVLLPSRTFERDKSREGYWIHVGIDLRYKWIHAGPSCWDDAITSPQKRPNRQCTEEGDPVYQLDGHIFSRPFGSCRSFSTWAIALCLDRENLLASFLSLSHTHTHRQWREKERWCQKVREREKEKKPMTRGKKSNYKRRRKSNDQK